MNANTLCETTLTVTRINVDGSTSEHALPETQEGWDAIFPGTRSAYIEEAYALIVNDDEPETRENYNKEASEALRARVYGACMLIKGEAYRQWMNEEHNEIVAL